MSTFDKTARRMGIPNHIITVAHQATDIGTGKIQTATIDMTAHLTTGRRVINTTISLPRQTTDEITLTKNICCGYSILNTAPIPRDTTNVTSTTQHLARSNDIAHGRIYLTDDTAGTLTTFNQTARITTIGNTGA